ncbi:MAG: lipid-A-disaccharide synthase [Boseongicola sp.]
MKFFLLAGEASGDKLGAALIAGLKSLHSDIEFRGVAGPLMQVQGMESIFPMDELSVMGIAEVLPRYADLRRRLNDTARDADKWGPDALITIDSPDFSLRLARLVKSQSRVRTVHYVAPSVWAWRSGRAKKMSAYIDQVLALLPFEPAYMETEGMRCDFVGHPVVSETVASDTDVEAFRSELNVGNSPIVLVLPGSRHAEVGRLAPIFGEALRPIIARHPDARVVVPAAAPVASRVIDAVKGWPGNPFVIDGRDVDAAGEQKRAAFRAANVAIAASGTVSLELAANGTPMVVAYDMNWLSWQVMSRMAKVDTVTLVNLVTGRNAVPEFLGPDCKPQAIADALGLLLTNDNARDDQIKAMAETMQKLGQGDEPPGLRAAQAVLDGLADQSDDDHQDH